MNKKQKLLEAIKTTYIKEVINPQPHELDEHIPIYNSQLTPIGYFNIRCYEELRKMLNTKKNECLYPKECNYPACPCFGNEQYLNR